MLIQVRLCYLPTKNINFFSAGPSKSEKKMKLTVKGGAAVDPDSGER